jgi:hypothetical protein
MQPWAKHTLFPKDGYLPGAAGPAYLSTDGYVLQYQGQPRNLQGLGSALPVPDEVVNQFVDAAVNKAWPMVEPKLRVVAQDYAKAAAIAVGAIVALQLLNTFILLKKGQ